jgi:hypothetical protein
MREGVHAQVPHPQSPGSGSLVLEGGGTSFVAAKKLDPQLTLLYRAVPSWSTRGLRQRVIVILWRPKISNLSDAQYGEDFGCGVPGKRVLSLVEDILWTA